MPRPLISFDAAGTLIQVRRPVGRTYAEFAREHGVAVEEAALKLAFRSVWGRLEPPLWPEGQASPDNDRAWWRKLVAEVFAEVLKAPLAEGVLEPLFESLYCHFARPDAWVVFEDVLPVLKDLGRDHDLCVLSNFDGRLRGILAGHGLDGFFKEIILSSEVGASKPHPRMFDTALRRMQTVAATSWHAGDDPRCDIQGAENAGWRAFEVTRPGEGLRTLAEKVRSEANRACATRGKG